MLRTEACSGAISDLAHVRTEDCLADSLTKSTIKPEALIRAVETGVLPRIDCNPPFRAKLHHRAFFTWEELSIPTPGDEWVIDDKTLTRIHHQPRKRGFFPNSEFPCPVSFSRILPNRQTWYAFECDDTHQLHDSWLTHNAWKTDKWWTGKTVFCVFEHFSIEIQPFSDLPDRPRVQGLGPRYVE